ncbi:PEPKR2 [Symbiodinium sp. CCMP2592]|nr:PEPKR2 [Symbiodinium sp. CCMP2592]
MGEKHIAGSQTHTGRLEELHPIPCVVNAQTLSLSDALPSSVCFDLSTVNLQIPSTLDDVMMQFQEGHWQLHRKFPAHMPLHPSAEVLRCMAEQPATLPTAGPGANWDAIEVFTDGSFNGKVSSWAFLVLGWASDSVQVIGWMAEQVVVGESLPLSIGATCHDALRGEQSALFWALAWLMQGPTAVPVHIWSDCLVALQQTSGSFGCQAEDSPARSARALYQARHPRSRSKANECVDGLAKWACKVALLCGTKPRHLLAEAARLDKLTWWWLIIDSVRPWTIGLRGLVSEVATFLSAAAHHRELLLVATDMRQTKHDLRASIRHDQKHRVTQAALEATTNPVADTVTALKPLLGPPKRRCRVRQGLPMVLDEKGNVADTPEEAEQIWIRHFSGLEDGKTSEPLDLVTKCFSRQLDRDLDLLSLSATDFPSRCELERSIRSTKTGRAAGVDNLPGEILHYAAGSASRHTRLFMHRQKPASIRFLAALPLEQVASPLQLGGLPHRLVTMASQAVRLFQHGAVLHKESYALVFLDLRETFYRIIRPLITGSRFNDEDFASVAATLRLAPDTLSILHAHLQSDSLQGQAGASCWADMSLSEVLDCTWFRFRRGPQVVETSIGSRPRDTCADIVFTFLFARVLDSLRTDLQAEGILTCLPWCDTMATRVTPVGARVRVVSQYRHLGGLIHHSGKVIREVRSRTALAHEAFQKHKRAIFGSPVIPLSSKNILFESLVLSILLHGAGTWTEIDKASISALSHAYTLMVAQMLRPLHQFDEALRLGPSRILAVAGLPSISVLLHVSRLRHLLPCVRLKIREIWAIAHWEGQWLQQVCLSLGWLHALTGTDKSTWEHSWEQWRDMMISHPGRWKALLRRAQTQATRQEAWDAARAYAAGLLSRQLKHLGGTLLSPAIETTDQRHGCALCGQTFSNYNKWSLHAFKKHGRIMEGRGILQGSQCQACLRHFQNNIRLCRHLRFTPACRLKLQQAGFACDAEPGVGSRKAAHPLRPQAPVVQAAGPSQPLQWQPVTEERQKPVAEILDCLCHLDFDGTLQTATQADIWQRLKTSFGCVCAPTGRLRLTVLAWAHLVSDYPPATQVVLRPFVDWLMQADLIEWLIPDPSSQEMALCRFRDCGAILTALDLTCVHLPEPLVSEDDITVVAPASWTSRQGVSFWRGALSFTHEDCLQEIADGHSLSFFEGPYEGTRFVLVACELPSQAEVCPDRLPDKKFHSQLAAAEFAGDLLRLFVRLLGLGIPSAFLDQCSWAVPASFTAAEKNNQVHCHEGGDNCKAKGAKQIVV